MVHSALLIIVFAVSMAINGQQEYKYDLILSEVAALKEAVNNLNFEMDKIRNQHDDMRDELRRIRSNRNSPDTYTLNRLNKNEPNREQREDEEKSTTLHKRSAYIPSFHLPRNISRVISGEKGEKGEKGASGIQGPKGDNGTEGPKGQKGSRGSIGPTGFKGDIGPMGLEGPKGSPGTRTKKVAFIARPLNDITAISGGKILLFSDVSLNLGDDYNPNTGYFECSVAGVYVFTWSIEINAGQSLSTAILVNGNIYGLQFASATSDTRDSRYSTVILQLDIADTVYVSANSPRAGGAVIGFMSSSFSGYLLN